MLTYDEGYTRNLVDGNGKSNLVGHILIQTRTEADDVCLACSRMDARKRKPSSRSCRRSLRDENPQGFIKGDSIQFPQE